MVQRLFVSNLIQYLKEFSIHKIPVVIYDGEKSVGLKKGSLKFLFRKMLFQNKCSESKIPKCLCPELLGTQTILVLNTGVPKSSGSKKF